ncbi:DUF484 family protein [Rhodovibrionaceae bacterium A322]
MTQDATSNPSSKAKAADKERAGKAAPTEDQVATYLRRHPDFLVHHSDLLDSLEVPARSQASTQSGVLDLQLAMVERLRAQKSQLEKERDALVLTSRSNAAAQDKVQRAVLLLLSAGSFEQLIDYVINDLADLLDLDVVTLCVEQDDDRLASREVGGVLRLPAGKIDSLLAPNQHLRLQGDIMGDTEIFGVSAALVGSQALAKLTLSPSSPPVLLALGARQIDHFDESQGTDLLQFLAQALEFMLRSWLDLPES